MMKSRGWQGFGFAINWRVKVTAKERRTSIGWIFTLILVVPISSFSQITFERTYGGADDDHGRSVQQTSDGGYIVAGRTTPFGATWPDVYLVKTNASGDTLWTKTYGDTERDLGESVQQTSDGGYIIAGWTVSFGAGSIDVYLLKTDSLGDTLWTRTYGGSSGDVGYSVQQTSDGGYIIAGTTSSFGAGGDDFYLIKTDSSGDTLWTKAYGGPDLDLGWSVQQTSDGGYIFVGYTASFGVNLDVYLVKTDSFGGILWAKTYGDSNTEVGFFVQQTSDGGYIVAGDQGIDIYLIKTDSLGNTLWTRTYGGPLDDETGSVQQTSDGGYIVAGWTESFGAGLADIYLIKTNSSGDTLWTRTFGGTLDDEGGSVKQTSDGGFIIAGGTESFGAGSGDVYLIKTDANGVVGVEEEDLRLKIEDLRFELLQNHPNPFHHSTLIRYQIPLTPFAKEGLESGHFQSYKEVSLTVYDLTGRLVETLVDGKQEPGVYQVQWEEKDQASGVYFYRLTVGVQNFEPLHDKSNPYIETKKLILIR